MTWKDYIKNWQRNFRNGWQFGDFFKSLVGEAGKIDPKQDTVYDLAATSGSSYGGSLGSYDTSQGVSQGVGQMFNDVTGVTASQQWQTSERLASQDYSTKERLAGQDFTHAENVLARDWQEQMSNTAIQRQMADARAAGVNPYYLFGASNASGAGVPVASGSSGTGQGASGVSAPGSGNSASAVTGAIQALGRLFSDVVKAAAK